MLIEGLIITFVKRIINKMKHRLEEFLKLEGLTSVKFAEIMQIQPSSVSHILSGRNNPNFDFVSRMLQRFPDLNPDWFINGIGEVYRSKHHEVGIKVTDVTRISQDKKQAETSNGNDQNNRSNVNEIMDIDAFTNVTNNPLHHLKSVDVNNLSDIDAKASTTAKYNRQYTDNELYNVSANNTRSKSIQNNSDMFAALDSKEPKISEKKGKQITKIVFFYSDSSCRVFEVE